MRLLLSTDTVGGVWDYAVTLANAAARDGHAVLLAVFGHPDGNQLEQLISNVVVECRGLPLEWLPATDSELLASANWLAELSRAWRADVAHLNQMSPPGLARFASPTVVVTHSDVCSWFQAVRGEAPPDLWTGYVATVRAGLAAATTVVAPSAYQASLIRSHFGRAADRVIHNGLGDAGPRHERPTRGSRPILVAAGRAWDEAKGFGLLDAALGLLGAQPTTHLFGSTEGPRGQRFTGHHVTCHGPVPAAELRRWMASATIYIGPSVYEPFGLAPLEAALQGCALLLSDIGSFRELWGGCAEFFPSGDAAGLAGAIEDLIADPARTAAIGEAARRRALEAYTVDRFAAEYLDLYRQLLESSLRGTVGTRAPKELASIDTSASIAVSPTRPHLEDRCV